jgi:two-component system, OmpR family, response regulator
MIAGQQESEHGHHPRVDTIRNRIVMVVDDDRVIVALLRHILERRGYVVWSAIDGREAAGRLQGEPPGLVLLDVILPYMDGFELIRQIRSTPGWAGVPIMMLTVKAQERNVVRALDAGADDYMVKPFKPEELAARVRRFLP